MGDISEMRALIVLLSVVGITIGLIATMPSEFFSTDVDNTFIPDPDTLELIAWNSTLTINATNNNWENFDLNGYHFQFNFDSPNIWCFTYAYWWVFTWDQDGFYWRNENNTDVTTVIGVVPTLNLTDIVDYDNPSSFQMKNSKTQIKATLSFNGTAYTDFQEALEADDLQITFNSDWSDRNTSINALSLIAMVLTGSLPDIASELSIVFFFVSWAFIATTSYLVFIFALRIVGAVFGGGGS